jgi:hypothetical protein
MISLKNLPALLKNIKLLHETAIKLSQEKAQEKG